MTKEEEKLLHLTHDLYEILLDQETHELMGREEDAETARMRAGMLAKKLYRLLKSEYGPGE